jgi:putative phosphoribosyl transferase
LARELPALERPIVLALPRGGVPVGAAVALAIDAPLDLFVVRTLGVPVQPELAMGAVASGGVRVVNEDVLRDAGVSPAVLEEATARERAFVESRERLYRGDRAMSELGGRDVVLVDDGLATGATMRAAVAAIHAHGPSRVVVAVPVAPAETVAVFERDGIEVVCPLVPRDFVSVGSWYRDFGQVSDEEVIRLIS